jgi:hypothetical protein
VRYVALILRNPDVATWTFEGRWLVVAETASRVRRDCASVVPCYVERIERLEVEIRALRAQLR